MNENKVESKVMPLSNGFFSSRLKDPIISTYIGSFLILNWKIVLYLFSSISVADKISHISVLLYGDCNIGTFDLSYEYLTSIGCILFRIVYAYMLPAIFTYLILIRFPVWLKKYYVMIQESQVEKLNQQFNAELKLSPVEKKIQELQLSFDREVDKNNDLKQQKDTANSTIERFEKNLREKDQEILRSKKEYEKIENELASSQRNSLAEVAVNSDLQKQLEQLKSQILTLEKVNEDYNTLLFNTGDGVEKKNSTEIERKIGLALELLDKYLIVDSFIDCAKELYLNDQPNRRYENSLVDHLMSIGLVKQHYEDEWYLEITDFGKQVFHTLQDKKK